MKSRKPTRRNYARGANAERRAMSDLLKPHRLAHPLFKLGAQHVTRSAGSHGEFDLVAQCPEVDVWLQVKSSPDLQRGKRELAKLERWLARYNKPKPAHRYLAGLVWVPHVGSMARPLCGARFTCIAPMTCHRVATRYAHRVITSANAYPSRGRN